MQELGVSLDESTEYYDGSTITSINTTTPLLSPCTPQKDTRKTFSSTTEQITEAYNKDDDDFPSQLYIEEVEDAEESRLLLSAQVIHEMVGQVEQVTERVDGMEHAIVNCQEEIVGVKEDVTGLRHAVMELLKVLKTHPATPSQAAMFLSLSTSFAQYAPPPSKIVPTATSGFRKVSPTLKSSAATTTTTTATTATTQTTI